LIVVGDGPPAEDRTALADYLSESVERLANADADFAAIRSWDARASESALFTCTLLNPS
jgi:hypothetical protein